MNSVAATSAAAYAADAGLLKHEALKRIVPAFGRAGISVASPFLDLERGEGG